MEQLRKQELEQEQEQQEQQYQQHHMGEFGALDELVSVARPVWAVEPTKCMQ